MNEVTVIVTIDDGTRISEKMYKGIDFAMCVFIAGIEAEAAGTTIVRVELKEW